MSSTRVKDRKGAHLDFYETPGYVIDGIVGTGIVNGRRLLEPSAGKGAIARRLKHHLPSLVMTAVEIQPEFQPALDECCDHVMIGDFFEADLEPQFDLVVANPPFSQAKLFIERCLGLLLPGGRAIFLLRLPFIASVKRHQFFQRCKPSHIFVLSQRPKFGGTNIDSCDYAWFCWEQGGSTSTAFDWIAPINRR